MKEKKCKRSVCRRRKMCAAQDRTLESTKDQKKNEQNYGREKTKRWRKQLLKWKRDERTSKHCPLHFPICSSRGSRFSVCRKSTAFVLKCEHLITFCDERQHTFFSARSAADASSSLSPKHEDKIETKREGKKRNEKKKNTTIGCCLRCHSKRTETQENSRERLFDNGNELNE